jgi:hypothetical protein
MENAGANDMSLWDENAEVLRNMTKAGDDLSVPREMDFSHVFATREGAIGFARRVDAEGLTPVVRPYEKPGFPFDVTVTTTPVVPTCTWVTETEQRLGNIAAEFGGKPDGWGCWKS